MSNVVPRKKPRAKKIPDLLQLKIELARITPTVWRRIMVPESITLGKLHQVLQIAFYWGDCHLHEFDFGGERFGIPDPDYDDELVRSETRIQLKTALGGAASFKYIYDFGDCWEHRIKVEKRLPGDPELRPCAMLLQAGNAAPPDDVGGASGYEDFVKIMADQNHPEHQSMLEWYGDAFDPAYVDLGAIGSALHHFKL